MTQTNNNEETLIRVGVIDDHPTILEGAFSILQNLDGVRAFLKARNGKELINYLENTDVRPDVLLMDVSMPEMDGMKATRIITDTYPSIKTIAFSGNDDDWSMGQMMIAGACAYLRKDASPAKIREAVIEVHKTRRYHADLYSLYGEGLKNFTEDIKNLVFTDNEKTFMQLLCKGLNYNKIAVTMKFTVKTIDYYRNCVAEKLNTNNQALLIIMILRINEVKLNESKNWKTD
jgi:DNA-binding NarL/FixJ family response regulator